MIKIIRKKLIQNDKVEPNENTFVDYIQLLNAVGATDIYINNIRIVYEHCRVDTLFGQTNVM